MLWLAIRSKNSLTYTRESVNIPFSIIIAARNEAVNLQRYLPFLLSQVHAKYEVIIALDRCEDNSLEVVKSFQMQYKNLRFVEIQTVPEGWSPKKYALTQAIALAQHPHLALTDADCEVGKYWLQHLSAAFVNSSAEIVLGIGYYYPYSGLLNAFIRFETFYTAFQYLGFCKLGLPYMGIGRNIAYQKAVFEKYKGFEAFKNYLSGDDDLFVNQYAKKNTTVCLFHEESHTYSEPKMTVRAWFRQKFRHVSAANAYTWQTKALLTLFHFSHLAIYFFGALSFLLAEQKMWVVFLFLGRLLLSWGIFIVANTWLKAKKMLYIYPVFDILYFFYNACIVPIGLIKKPTWN
ncbi:MAG: glycosyltransferase [Bacteroidia bacterium]